MDQIKIGKFIAACRKERGFFQKDIAQKLGVSEKNRLKMGVRKRYAGSDLHGAAVRNFGHNS